MAVTDAFLAVCRTRINATTEKSAFATALTNLWNATRVNKGATWQAAFGDAQDGGSPAFRLHKAIREVVTAYNQEAANGAPYGNLAIQAAINTLAAEYIPRPNRPLSKSERDAILERLILHKQASS
jgi:hypothetical protein